MGTTKPMPQPKLTKNNNCENSFLGAHVNETTNYLFAHEDLTLAIQNTFEFMGREHPKKKTRVFDFYIHFVENK